MLEHYAYCPRQCALIHVEQTYEENAYTIRGNQSHERVHETGATVENGIRVERGLPLWSDRLGISGIADVVEFPDDVPYPVEYKSGKRLKTVYRTAAQIQLCGQTLCLEDMLAVAVPRGALFFRGSQRRSEVEFDDFLRTVTLTTITAVRRMLAEQIIPAAVNDLRCPNCSLIDSCMPELRETHRLHQLAANLFVEGD